MTLRFGQEGPREFTLTDDQFAAISGLARESFGLDLQPAKRSLVYSRLTRRLRALGLTSFGDYVALVTGPQGSSERVEMLSSLTTNVTNFFREKHHFDTLTKIVLPDAVKAARAGGRVRLWSAGCSAGQEPYSIAISVLAACPEAARLDFKILATDVDPAILAKARRGIYPVEEASALPPQMRASVTRNGSDPGTFEISPEVRSIVHFGELNLVKDWPVKGPFRAIFCRNVAIYFDKETQIRLWSRFVPLIEPGGVLFIGHSERIAGPATGGFRSIGVTSYERVAQTSESRT